jgi:hypothetical protein
MLASRLLQHTTSRALLLLLCVCHALPVDHSNLNQNNASIESLVSHPATAAGNESMPIGADAEGHKPPAHWSSVECRVQGDEPAALGVG